MSKQLLGLFIFCVVQVNSDVFEYSGLNTPSFGNIIGSINITDEYIVSFDIILNSSFMNDTHKWGSILQIGESNWDVSVFLRDNDTHLFVGSSNFDFGSKMTETNSNISVGYYYHIRIEVNQSVMNVYLNDTLSCNIFKNPHNINNERNIYIGSNTKTEKFGVPDVLVSNLVIETIDYNELIYDALSGCDISSNNLVSWYVSHDYTVSPNATLKWLDRSGKGNHILNVHVSDGISKHSDTYIYGSTSDYIVFPTELSKDGYTLFHLTKYGDTGPYNRIFTGGDCSTDNYWFSGFDNHQTGIAYHDGWVTSNVSELRIVPDVWVLSTDQHNLYRGNKINLTNFNSNDGLPVVPKDYNISINYHCMNQSSNWALYEVMIFDTELNLQQYTCIEKYLHGKYSCGGDNKLGSWSCSPTSSPSINPTNSFEPTITPSEAPTGTPTNVPTLAVEPQTPSETPTEAPTDLKTDASTHSNTNPTASPTTPTTTPPTRTPTNSPIKYKETVGIIDTMSGNSLQIILVLSFVVICLVTCIIGISVISFMIIKKKKKSENDIVHISAKTENNPGNEGTNDSSIIYENNKIDNTETILPEIIVPGNDVSDDLIIIDYDENIENDTVIAKSMQQNECNIKHITSGDISQFHSTRNDNNDTNIKQQPLQTKPVMS